MSDYLRVFEGKALAEELTKAGHAVSDKTVQRWKKGTTKPKPQDITAIRNLIGATLPATKEAAPPSLEERLDALMTRDEVVELVARIQRDVTKEIRANRETIVAALSRRVMRQALEGNEQLLTRLHDVLVRVETRLAE